MPHIGPKKTVFENQYVRIDRFPVQFEGFTKEFYVNDYGPKVGLLLMRGENVLLVRQYRFLVNSLAWEIPGGGIDESETPEQAVMREAQEEARVRCRSVEPLLFFHPGLDTFHNPTHLFYCNDFEPLDDVYDPREVVERHWIPVDRCMEMIFRGEILDNMTILAVFAFQLRIAGKRKTFQ